MPGHVRSCQVRTRSVKGRSGQVTPCKVRTIVGSGLVRLGKVMSRRVRIKSGHVRSDQVRLGYVRSIQ